MDDERFKARFDGAAAFANLTPDVQAAIGGLALEIVVNWNGIDAYADRDDHCRPFDAADPVLLDRLHALTADAIPSVIEAEPLPVPSLIGQVCRRCGCTENAACVGLDNVPCRWVEPNLCSACEKVPT